MSQKRPDRVEQCGDFTAEYTRWRNSQGQEELLVCLRHDTVGKDDSIQSRAFLIEMDALERFASYAVPPGELKKPLDSERPDRVEHFKKEYTARFHAGTSRDGNEEALVRLEYLKERPDGLQATQEMSIRLKALKEFSDH